MDLEWLRDPRVERLMLYVLADERERLDVRMHVLRRLRDGRYSQPSRLRVADAFRQATSDHSAPELRLRATLALAIVVDIDGVLTTLGRLALDRNEPIDLRYAAFTSLERAGPTTECVTILRRLTTDDTLGGCARSLLAVWRVE